MADEYPVLFKKALAANLHTANLGLYKTSGIYAVGEDLAARPPIITGGPDLPTTLDNCIVLTLLQPINEGRADRVERIQLYTRIKGGNSDIQNLGFRLEQHLDEKSNIPAGFYVSRVWLFSQLYLTADTQGRRAVTQTFYFRGRRP